MQLYSDVPREEEPTALPDCEVFELTATEAAAADEDLVMEYSRRHEFRLASMNRKVREAMLDAIVEEEGITGGWFYWSCMPGCLPDSEAMGPYATQQEAVNAARDAH